MIGLVALALAGVPHEAALFGALLADLDADHDGRLSQAEYLRVDGVSEFPVIDADHDGYATAGELADWARVTQPRPRERLRPDTLGFAVLGATSGGAAQVASGGAKATAAGGGATGTAKPGARAPARAWPLSVAVVLGLLGVGGAAVWWRRRRA